jgi:hypothetical protein
LPTEKRYIEIFKKIDELNNLYPKLIMGKITIDEYHDNLCIFMIDFTTNIRNKDVFGHVNIESLRRHLVNITTLSFSLKEYRDLGNNEKKIQLEKDLTMSYSHIIETFTKCREFYDSTLLASDRSALINKITTIQTEPAINDVSNQQDLVLDHMSVKRKKTYDRKHTLNKLCFVDMPFGKKKDYHTGIEVHFDHIYETAIESAVISADLEPLRGDEENRGGIIHQAMFARLLLSEYVIADLTTANANVYYELGIRHAARPFTTILIHGNLHPLQFDIAPNRTIIYNIEKDGTISKESALELREQIKNRLDIIIKEGARTDSPLFELIKNYKKIDFPHELINTFQDRIEMEKNFNDQFERAKSHKNDTEKIRSLQEIRSSLGNLKDKNDNILTSLLLAFRSVSAWEDMIQLCESFSYDLRNSYMIKQQEAFALNRRNGPDDRRRAINILEEIRQIYGDDPETMGLLGRIYKDMYKDAKNENDSFSSLGFLEKSIDTYTRGFYSDPRDYYPGINAITLLIVKGDKQSYYKAKELITSVNLALARRGGLDSQNYWDLTTILEIACIENDSELIDRVLPKIAIYAKETFMPETTGDNIKMLRDSLPRHYEKEKQESLISNLDRVIVFLDGYHKKMKGG